MHEPQVFNVPTSLPPINTQLHVLKPLRTCQPNQAPLSLHFSYQTLLHFLVISATTTATVSSPYNRKKKFQVHQMGKKKCETDGLLWDASFMRWTVHDVVNVFKFHWLPCFFGAGLLFFMAVEYTLRMVPASSPPIDLGFIVTQPLHRLLSSSPELNTLLAFLNTVFVGMQSVYILWAFVIEGRARATIAALFMFTCRGILGYSTQLPVPEGFLGSGVDFPVGNVSFFLFFSGHVAGSVIASLDMRRMQRWGLALTFDVLNVLQAVRLLGTRGHYTIDLAVGVGAGILFDALAGKYQESKRKDALATAKEV